MRQFLDILDDVLRGQSRIKSEEELKHFIFLKFQIFDCLIHSIQNEDICSEILANINYQIPKVEGKKGGDKKEMRIFSEYLLESLSTSMFKCKEDSNGFHKYLILNSICEIRILIILASQTAFSKAQIQAFFPIVQNLHSKIDSLNQDIEERKSKYHMILNHSLFLVFKVSSLYLVLFFQALFIRFINDLIRKYENTSEHEIMESYKTLIDKDQVAQFLSEEDEVEINEIIQKKNESSILFIYFLSFGERLQWLTPQFFVFLNPKNSSSSELTQLQPKIKTELFKSSEEKKELPKSGRTEIVESHFVENRIQTEKLKEKEMLTQKKLDEEIRRFEDYKQYAEEKMFLQEKKNNTLANQVHQLQEQLMKYSKIQKIKLKAL